MTFVRACLFGLLLGLASVVGAATLELPEYREALRAIETDLRSGEWARAKNGARGLLGDEVRFGGESVAVDAWALGTVLEVSDHAAARHAAAALAQVAAALEAPGGETAARPDRSELERLAAELELSGPEAGGEVAVPTVEAPGFWQRTLETVATALEWVWEKFLELLAWLLDRLFGERSETAGGVFDTRLVTLLVILAALVLVVMAIRSWRRSGRGEDAELDLSAASASAPASDADPRSREVDEWQLYARELEAQGRLREAIRAWYHSVLVTLYRRGILHYRKGRTNWEYVASLGPELAWRPHFVALTRVFEAEWYGHAESSPEALERSASEARAVVGAVERSGVEGLAA